MVDPNLAEWEDDLANEYGDNGAERWRERCRWALARIKELEVENERLRAVTDAAKAEVRAQGYRSSDMAHALEAHSGEFWFETELPPEASRCGAQVSVEMDDGLLNQRCWLPPHDADTKHRFVPTYREATDG